MQRAFTARSTWGLLGKLLSDVSISPQGQEKFKQIKWIWDTGASSSCIDIKIAQDLGLISSDKITSLSAHWAEEKDVYFVDVLLPNNVRVNWIKAVECNLLNMGIGMLIGMDIICHGTFSVSNFQGRTAFSFSIPSVREIDYVPEANRLNDPKSHPPTNVFPKKK